MRIRAERRAGLLLCDRRRFEESPGRRKERLKPRTILNVKASALRSASDQNT
jgi:hypothetical protein